MAPKMDDCKKESQPKIALGITNYERQSIVAL